MWQGVVVAAALMQAASAPEAPQAPPPRELAPGVHLIPGAILPQRGPDGNSVVFTARDGLIVVDTGRHAWHSDAILGFARAQSRPIAAILNTHWHLDHSSGNGRLKAAYPDARVYTTDAIERVLAPGGFLVRNLDQTRAMLDNPDLSAVQKEEVRIYLATMDERDILRPDVLIERSGRTRIAGKRLDVRVAERAVTDSDIWLYDRASRIAVIGDLVTLPAPFFETACPEQWSAALDAVWATPFETAVPGHGEPMSRAQFDSYRQGFNAFMACVNSDAEAAQCGTVWVEGVRPLLTPESEASARAYAEYYVGFLRPHGGRSADCLAD
ncbi:MAG: MBL fold metallo-hydrolase [Hyphomonadaceae bacterium]